jgi:hypothetical protein
MRHRIFAGVAPASLLAEEVTDIFHRAKTERAGTNAARKSLSAFFSREVSDDFTVPEEIGWHKKLWDAIGRCMILVLRYFLR